MSEEIGGGPETDIVEVYIAPPAPAYEKYKQIMLKVAEHFKLGEDDRREYDSPEIAELLVRNLGRQFEPTELVLNVYHYDLKQGDVFRVIAALDGALHEKLRSEKILPPIVSVTNNNNAVRSVRFSIIFRLDRPISELEPLSESEAINFQSDILELAKRNYAKLSTFKAKLSPSLVIAEDPDLDFVTSPKGLVLTDEISLGSCR